MDLSAFTLFTIAAIVLLGSPGPAIAALIAIGRQQGFARGLRFYGGLQLGLALVAAACAAGLFSLLQQFPGATKVMLFLAAAYLVWLAWKIATAPLTATAPLIATEPAAKAGLTGGAAPSCRSSAASVGQPTALGGFVLGVTNPKAYASFASLMAAYLIVPDNAVVDGAIKWAICVALMVSMDLAWLWLGTMIRKVSLSPGSERLLNYGMGATVLVVAALALIL